MKKIICLLSILMLFFTSSCSSNENKIEDGNKVSIVAQDYYVVYEDNDTAEFAAKELKTFTDKMNGGNMPILKYGDHDLATGYGIFILSSQFACANNEATIPETVQYDGFAFIPSQNKLIITSNYYRGLSFGVYELLEQNGLRFYAAYENGTYIPQNNNVNYRLSETKVNNPDFEFRTIYNDQGWSDSKVLDEEMTRVYLWYYRNRYNRISSPEGIHGGAAAWIDADKLDLSFIAGGHKACFPNTTSNPKWQRTDENGNKTDSGNFCVSQSDAIEYIANAVYSIFKSNRRIEAFQLLGEDVYGGAWCYCDDCIQYTPHQQMEIVANAIGDRLKEDFPYARVQYSMYHDTLDVSELLDPIDNVEGFYWLRVRCLSHSFEDRKICQKCKTYYKYLTQALHKFNNVSFCGYYGDSCLYNIMEANACDQVADDLRVCKRLGVKDSGNLCFSELGNTLSDAQMIVFNMLQWNVDVDYYNEVINYYVKMFGATNEEAKNLYDLRYKFTDEVFSYCGYSTDKGIEAIEMKNGEQEFAKSHLLKFVNAPETMKKIKAEYQKFYDRSTNNVQKEILNKKIIQAELSYIKSLSNYNTTLGQYLKVYVWDTDYDMTYQKAYETGCNYEKQAQELGKLHGCKIFGLNEVLIQNMGMNNYNYYKWVGGIV